MANPVSINRASLLTRITPGAFFLFVTFSPDIFVSIYEGDASIHIFQLNPSNIALFLILSLLIGEVINYIRISYYFVPQEFRTLVYKESNNIIALTRRKRLRKYINDNSIELYNRISAYLSKVYDQRLQTFVKSRIIKFSHGGSAEQGSTYEKEGIDTRHQIYKNDEVSIADIFIKFPEKPYAEVSGEKTIADVKERNNLPQEFSDAKKIYHLLIKNINEAENQKTSDMKNIFIFNKNITISFWAGVLASLFYHYTVENLLILTVLIMFVFVILILPILFFAKIMENVDKKYTRQILLEYDVKFD